MGLGQQRCPRRHRVRDWTCCRLRPWVRCRRRWALPIMRIGRTATGSSNSAVFTNKAQGFAATVTAAGIAVHSGPAEVGLSTRAGMGRPGAMRTLTPVAPRTSANVVTYAQQGLVSTYSNGPAGIEQTFDVAARPAGADGALRLALTVSGATPRMTGDSVTLPVAGGTALNLGGLAVIDATGRTLGASLSVSKGQIMLDVNDSGAVYPLHIDPLLQEGKMLTASDTTGVAHFGYSVALSADGSVALIGAPNDNSNDGATWMFTRTGTTWTQQGGKLYCQRRAAERRARFGWSVALSADGSVALISLPFESHDGGDVVVFTRFSATTWTEQGAVPGPNVPALFWLHECGVIGGWQHGVDRRRHIRRSWCRVGIHAFFWDAVESVDSAELARSPLPNVSGGAEFGRSVALSADGNTGLVGAGGDGGGVGAVWVFTRSGTTWTAQDELLANDETGNAFFGWSLALSADGDAALIGGMGDNTGVGAAWIFIRSGTVWTQQGSKLTANDEFGAGQLGGGQFGVECGVVRGW